MTLDRRHVAFLRGINVGGRQIVKMDALRGVFETLGFLDVRTILASGNVLFEADRASEGSLARKIEAALSTAFGLDLKVLIRTREELQRLADARPFAGVRMTPDVRTFVTFLRDAPREPGPLPSGEGFRVVAVMDRAVLTVVDLSSMTTDLMRLLEKTFGREITTRSWTTVERILRADGERKPARARRPARRA
jgi:uncharacterized protein (DUF1697 family)